jgi:hypothetical protein
MPAKARRRGAKKSRPNFQPAFTIPELPKSEEATCKMPKCRKKWKREQPKELKQYVNEKRQLRPRVVNCPECRAKASVKKRECSGSAQFAMISCCGQKGSAIPSRARLRTLFNRS